MLRQSHHRNRAYRAAVAGVLCSVAGAAQGLEWTHVPAVTLQSRHDDNYRLAPIEEREVLRTNLQAGALVVARDERFRFDLAPRVNSIAYDDEREPDRNDFFTDLGLSVRDERHEWTFGGGYARDGTLTTAFEDTGFTETDVDRTSTRFSTGLTGFVSERNSYGLTVARQEVRFEEAFLSPLIDYHYDNVDASYVRTINEGAQVTFTAFAARLSYETQAPATNNEGISVAWARRFSPSLETSFGVGAYRTTDGSIGETAEQISVDISATKRWDRTFLSLALSAEPRPSGFGALERRESLEVRFDRRLSPELNLGARLLAGENTPEGGAGPSAARRFGLAGLYASWRLAERWSLTFSVDSLAQEFSGQPRARSLAGGVTLGYRGRPT